MISLTKRDGCICSRKCPLAFLIFHPFVSLLFLRTHLTVLGKNYFRIVCRTARQVTETMMRSISCRLQLRLQSNESKKYGRDIKNVEMDVRIL